MEWSVAVLLEQGRPLFFQAQDVRKAMLELYRRDRQHALQYRPQEQEWRDTDTSDTHLPARHCPQALSPTRSRARALSLPPFFCLFLSVCLSPSLPPSLPLARTFSLALSLSRSLSLTLGLSLSLFLFLSHTFSLGARARIIQQQKKTKQQANLGACLSP